MKCLSNVLLKTKEIYNDLNQTEKIIATYLLDNTNNVLNLSIKELSIRSGVSQAAWVRFCKTLGFTGLKDLKKELINDEIGDRFDPSPDNGDKYSDIKYASEASTIAERVCRNNIQAIESTLSIVDFEQIDKAVEAIMKAKRIVFFGTGASGVVATDAQFKFMRIGKNAISYCDHHMQMTVASTLTKDDVAFIISYSGATREMIEISNIAQNSGAVIIAMTKYGKNVINQCADIILHTSATEIVKRSGAMGSRIAQLTVIDILFTCVANRSYDDIEKSLNNSYKYTSKHKVDNK